MKIIIFFSFLNLFAYKFSFKVLFKVQKYLYKSVSVYDMSKALSFQKLILLSNSSRFLSIREVTQLDIKRHVPGVDGLICSSFLERFKLNEYLKSNINNWFPNIIKRVMVMKKNGESYFLEVPTVADRCWYCLVQFAIEPAHEAIFDLRSFGFRPFISVDKIYSAFYYNLNNHSFGLQKRVFSVDLQSIFNSINFHYLLKKIIIPRSIKLGIFRSLNLGLKISFPNFYAQSYDLTAVLSNVYLDGIESIHSSIRFGYNIVYFLKPNESETILLKKLEHFLILSGLDSTFIKFKLYSTQSGFDFLYWNFKVLSNGKFLCIPSFQRYQDFFLRIKHIINNSNYGAVCFFKILTFKIFRIMAFRVVSF